MSENASGGEGTLMASDYDTQLIESVTVRRGRLLSAFLFGTNPFQQRWLNTLRLLVFGVALAAGIAAACVGYSFISSMLARADA